MPPAALCDQLKRFPKVDLHRHLEGSVTPETLFEVARRFGGKLPTNSLDELRPMIQATSEEAPGYQAFLDKFKIFRGFYPNREAIEAVACRAVQEAAADSVRYLELRYSPTHFGGRGRFEEPDVAAWIQGALKRAARDCDIVVTPVLTISRDYGIELAEATVDMALSLPEGYFCGLDIAGNELEHEAGPFAHLFARVKRAGWGLTVHAGEACGPENVAEAVRQFNADRIGHGIRAADDGAVMELLRERDVLLEVCLTSNLHTGVVASIGKHPIRALRAGRVPVSLNTDDPAISAITLTDEYVLAVSRLGMTVDDLKTMNRQALRHAFHPDVARLQQQLGRCWD